MVNFLLTKLRTWMNVIFLCVCYTATAIDNVTLLTYLSNCLIVELSISHFVSCVRRLILKKIYWLFDRDVTALSAQIGYIMPLISMLQLTKVKLMRKLTLLRVGNTINHYNKWLFNLAFGRGILRHERHHESKQNQTTQKIHKTIQLNKPRKLNTVDTTNKS